MSPLIRSELESGRARQRRRFTSVPEAVAINWLFTSTQARAFIAWFRDAITDGADWFECPLDHPALGLEYYVCRFSSVYSGPNRVGPDLWSISANLELRERANVLPGAGNFPEYILDASIFDIAMNSFWPLNQWDRYAVVADTAINEDWPQP